MTRAPKRVTSLVDLAVDRSVRETGALDAAPAAAAWPTTADLAKTLFTEGHTRKEAP